MWALYVNVLKQATKKNLEGKLDPGKDKVNSTGFVAIDGSS